MDGHLNEFDTYKYAMEYIQDIIWELDCDFCFTFVSPNAKTLTGYETHEIVGRCMLDFLKEESRAYVVDSVRKTMAERSTGADQRPILYDVEFKNKDGTAIWFEVSSKPIIENGKLAGFIGMSRDISEKKARESEVERYISELELINHKLDVMATFDMLTGIYNRRKLERDLILEAKKAAVSEKGFSLIMFDIDGFKQINDRYGHKKGDTILKEMADVIKGSLRTADGLFRWGGDEFVVLLPETSLAEALEIAERLRQAAGVFDFDLEQQCVTISLGAGEYEAQSSIEEFLTRVDQALLMAKAHGKNRVEKQ